MEESEEESEEESCYEESEEESSEESIEEESYVEESYEEESEEEQSYEEVSEEEVSANAYTEEYSQEYSSEEESSEPVVEESKEESKVEEPKKEESNTEESKKEESKKEESKKEESKPEVKEVKIVAEYGNQDYGESSYVAKTQNRLYELGYTNAQATGYFDENTIYAVMNFQEMNGLEATGRVDEKTMKMLESKDAVSAFFNMIFGDYDEVAYGPISALQSRLKELEYFTGDVDGHFGKTTKLAVEMFQKDNNLDKTGNADVTTLLKIYKTDAAHNQNVGCIVYGMRSDDAAKMIARLAQLRYLASSKGNVFDDEVLAAVHEFQKEAGFEQADKMTPDMLKVLYSGEAPRSAEYTNLKVGYTGSDVTDLQENLAKLDYYDGKTNGVYTPSVEESVKEFQKENDLEETGVADTSTVEKIETVKKAEEKKAQDQKYVLKTANVTDDDALKDIAKGTVKTPDTAPKKTVASVSNEAPSGTMDSLPLVALAGAFLALSSALIAVIIAKKRKRNSIIVEDFND